MYNEFMSSSIWDYREKDLRKSKKGKILLLERSINYGPGKGKKIKLSQVKKNWSLLNLFPLKKRLFKLLIWDK